ncbi:MAG: M20/M25/M40 family metallo-hydrolase [Crocinitomicaceae bacterium]|nr:M20/M25/M40 family metallo-hydrolase [Crocinitomicaceae bacterium]
MRSLFLIFTMLIGSFSFGQIEEVRRITEKLCSPEFHGRGYVNKGDSIAAEFLKSEFLKLGVKPFDQSYFQPFNLDVNTFPGDMIIRHQGKELIPGVHFSIDPSSVGRKGQLHLKEVTAAQALNVEEMRAIVTEMLNKQVGDEALVFDMTIVSKDTIKLLKGITPQLAHYVPIVEVVNDKFTWSVGRDERYFPFLQIQDSVINKAGVLNLNIESKFLKDYQSQNVIGYIPSKKKCAKTILFTAHYDHLGRMGAYTYFPGANDNASGTAMLFTMAKYFKENPSNYNIMFVAFGGEEAGLVGSKYFVENPILKLKKIRFVVNLDIMGSGEDGITVVNGTAFEKEFALLQEINKEDGLLKEVKVRGPSANSDHYWFTLQDVPAFFIYTRGPNKHYHDVFDEYEELSFLEYQDITSLLVRFVNRLEKK